MLMIRPQRLLTICDITACVIKNAPVRFVESTSSQSFRFIRRARISRVIPALLTRIFTPPK
jgi:hypothetical protein